MIYFKMTEESIQFMTTKKMSKRYHGKKWLACHRKGDNTRLTSINPLKNLHGIIDMHPR